MSKAVAYSAAGAKKDAAVTLPKEVFGLDANHDLLNLSYQASLAELRVAGAKTLLRGEVRGGGKKPWRQKGTGRARAGSRRSPIWRGGGITFGPTGNENHLINLNAKQKRLATAQALSAMAVADNVLVIESLESKDGKAAGMRKLLDKIGATGKVLLVLDKKNDLTDRATRNLSGVNTVAATYLNVRNILDSDVLVFTKPALDSAINWLSGQKPEPKVQQASKPASQTSRPSDNLKEETK